ncbi:MAG: ATP-binding protein [Candidatus Thiodiazotropha endolucinida]
MTIEKGDFDSIEEDDLQELLEAGVPEGLRLDYKLTTYGRSDRDKKEFLKDISAFANSHGGHLVIGVQEEEGSIVDIPGIDTDCDAEILRFEQMLRNAIEPKIPDVRMKQINLANGNRVILIRIPRSWNPPHRVTAQGSNKFYTRHSAGIHEPGIEELRAMFNQSESALEKAKIFRDNRISQISAGEGARPLVGNGRLFFHIIPTAAFSGLINLDVEEIHNIHQSFRPIASRGMNSGFNFHGYRNERDSDLCHGYTQIYRNGIVEATMANIVRERDGQLLIGGLGIEQYFFEIYENYLNGLRDLNVPLPLIAMISLEGVMGARYAVYNNMFADQEPLLNDNLICLPECVLESYGTTQDYHKAIRPAFDAVWNAIGYARSQFFNEDGIWIGNPNR